MNKTRRTFSIRVSERESRIIDELKGAPYHINMSDFLRDKIVQFYNEIKNDKNDKK